jgi:hypothetical protein
MTSMLANIRKRINYVNVIATLALLFAMTGGALAAKKYLITSTKQISPKALAEIKKDVKGANGVPGAQGSQGAAGVQGAKGNNGVNGTNGNNGNNGLNGGTGPKGTTGTNGVTGASGATGPTGQTGFTKTLPPGDTEKGSWAIAAYETPASVEFYSPISFNIPLAAELQESRVHILKESAAPTTECPGSAEEPEALAGSLCVYTVEESNVNLNFMAIVGVNGFGGASPAGAVIIAGTKAAGGRLHMYGSWAVTAP